MIKCIVAGRRSGKTRAAAEWIKSGVNGIIVAPYQAQARNTTSMYGVRCVSPASTNLIRGESFDRVVFDEAFFMDNPHDFYLEHFRSNIATLEETRAVFIGTPRDSYPYWLDNEVFKVYTKSADNTWESLLDNEDSRRWTFEF